MAKKKAMLALADGWYYEGVSVGAEGEAVGEVVFNTSMTGYQEILTDPSYEGQLVTMTYPQIGNCGVNLEDVESRQPFMKGFIVKEYTPQPSNWRATEPLHEYMKRHGIVGIEGIDTRSLVRHLRIRCVPRTISVKSERFSASRVALVATIRTATAPEAEITAA